MYARKKGGKKLMGGDRKKGKPVTKGGKIRET
jgi:hypothetical protein